MRSESRRCRLLLVRLCRASRLNPRTLTGGYKYNRQHAINGYFMRFISKIEGANKEVFSSHLFLLEVEMDVWTQQFRKKRLDYGVSQSKFSVALGISRSYLTRIEGGKVVPPDDTKRIMEEVLERFNPEAPLTLLFDYVKVRFPTTDAEGIIKNIMKLNVNFMVHEDHAPNNYQESYIMGDIFLMASDDLEKGVLLELKGRGCRQFESFLEAQGRSWFDFFEACMSVKAVMKRLDLAINDITGILSVPELTRKCENRECITRFRTFKSYRSGELIKNREEDKLGMGNTLYIGSLKSEVYICLYEKDYEQYVKFGIPIDETPIKNRFELRLKDDRAQHAVEDLLYRYDVETTVFSIINYYIRFVEPDASKRRTDWKTNARWACFLGENRGKLKLTTAPEPYTLDRTMNWLARQVAPTLKMVLGLDNLRRTDLLNEMVEHAKLTKKQKKVLEQEAASIEEVISM